MSEAKDKEPTRATTAVAYPVDLVQKLRVISAHREEHICDILDRMTRKQVDREHRACVEAMHRDANGGEG